MAIKKKVVRRGKPVIDISGPAGNAWSLLGYADTISKHLRMDTEVIIAEMKSGDYENLLLVFDKYFGDYVDLER